MKEQSFGNYVILSSCMTHSPSYKVLGGLPKEKYEIKPRLPGIHFTRALAKLHPADMWNVDDDCVPIRKLN